MIYYFWKIVVEWMWDVDLNGIEIYDGVLGWVDKKMGEFLE